MTPEQLFSFANKLALAGWLVLLTAGRRTWTEPVVRAIVALLALVYVVLIALFFFGANGGFSSLDGVARLFANPWLLLAGWIHYLAFDLFIGHWQVRDAAARRLSPWLVAPCLVMTFLFGPAGWLLYFGIRRRGSTPPGRTLVSARLSCG